MLLSNFTIYLIMKYGRTIPKIHLIKDMFNSSKKYINIFLKAIDIEIVNSIIRFTT